MKFSSWRRRGVPRKRDSPILAIHGLDGRLEPGGVGRPGRVVSGSTRTGNKGGFLSRKGFVGSTGRGQEGRVGGVTERERRTGRESASWNPHGPRRTPKHVFRVSGPVGREVSEVSRWWVTEDVERREGWNGEVGGTGERSVGSGVGRVRDRVCLRPGILRDEVPGGSGPSQRSKCVQDPTRDRSLPGTRRDLPEDVIVRPPATGPPYTHPLT